MPDKTPDVIDAGPHATPDQVRAAEKRAAAAATAAGVEARSQAPKGRRATPSDEA